MVFYKQEDIDSGIFKKEKKSDKNARLGAGVNESYEELSLTQAPKITKHKQLKKLNEIAEPSTVKDKLKVFIDFKFK